jgi:hypothetical protein
MRRLASIFISLPGRVLLVDKLKKGDKAKVVIIDLTDNS